MNEHNSYLINCDCVLKLTPRKSLTQLLLCCANCASKFMRHCTNEDVKAITLTTARSADVTIKFSLLTCKCSYFLLSRTGVFIGGDL